MSNVDTFNQINEIIAACIMKNSSDIRLETKLIDELGMDSLDFLDVIFAIEKRFKIKFRNGEFEKLLRLDILLEENDGNGLINASELKNLQPYLSELREGSIEQVTPMQLFAMISVESLVIATEELLQTQN